MIISLTERCSEGCSHCFINSLPKSPIMSEETLHQTLAFLDRIQPRAILLSGGEFTEHPDFHRFSMQIIKGVRRRGGAAVSLLSNGSWFFDEDKKEKMLDLIVQPEVVIVQVRTHKKYYPNYQRTIAAKAEIESLSQKIALQDDGIMLFPLGRALANHKGEYERKMPICANLLGMAKRGDARTFAELIYILESNGRFCSPFVSSKGIIHAGETPFCEELGHITNSDEQVLQNIIKNCKPKNRCGLTPNLPLSAKLLLGVP